MRKVECSGRRLQYICACVRVYMCAHVRGVCGGVSALVAASNNANHQTRRAFVRPPPLPSPQALKNSNEQREVLELQQNEARLLWVVPEARGARVENVYLEDPRFVVKHAVSAHHHPPYPYGSPLHCQTWGVRSFPTCSGAPGTGYT